jgi:hypothetical protein
MRNAGLVPDFTEASASISSFTDQPVAQVGPFLDFYLALSESGVCLLPCWVPLQPCVGPLDLDFVVLPAERAEVVPLELFGGVGDGRFHVVAGGFGGVGRCHVNQGNTSEPLLSTLFTKGE